MCRMYGLRIYPERIACSAVAVLVSLVTVAWSGPINAQSAEVQKTYPSLSADPLQSLQISNYLLGLVIVFATLAVASWLLRRYQPRVGRGLIQIQACLPLGGKERIMLVEVQGRHMLIGVCPSGISLLQDMNSSIPSTSPEAAAKSPAAVSSGNWLQQTLKSVKGR